MTMTRLTDNCITVLLQQHFYKLLAGKKIQIWHKLMNSNYHDYPDDFYSLNYFDGAILEYQEISDVKIMPTKNRIMCELSFTNIDLVEPMQFDVNDFTIDIVEVK